MGTVLSTPPTERPRSECLVTDNIPMESRIKIGGARISTSKSVTNFRDKSAVAEKNAGHTNGFFRNGLINSLSLKKLNLTASSTSLSSKKKTIPSVVDESTNGPALISISTISDERQMYTVNANHHVAPHTHHHPALHTSQRECSNLQHHLHPHNSRHSGVLTSDQDSQNNNTNHSSSNTVMNGGPNIASLYPTRFPGGPQQLQQHQMSYHPHNYNHHYNNSLSVTENTNLIKSLSCHTLKFAGTSAPPHESGSLTPVDLRESSSYFQYPTKLAPVNNKENMNNNYRLIVNRNSSLESHDFHNNNLPPPPMSITMPSIKSNLNASASQHTNGVSTSTSLQKLQKRFMIHASTGELLKCLGYFLFYACPQVTQFQPNSAVIWVKAIDRSLIMQGWAEIYFVNPANVVFLYMLLRDFAEDPARLRTQRHIQALTQVCLYLSYAYMGNEISYPLKPFLLPPPPPKSSGSNRNHHHQQRKKSDDVTATASENDSGGGGDQDEGEETPENGNHIATVAEVEVEEECASDSGTNDDEDAAEEADSEADAEQVEERRVDRERDKFWERSLEIINRKSADMLKINADPSYFTQMFTELKSYSVNFS